MHKACPLSPFVAGHHRRCQVTSKPIADRLHALYLAYDGPITKLESVRTFDEFVLTRHPERPGFRTYSE